ncbi:hypothetical protein FS837_009003 [Tulasnella sp. UAMH 9824]|nr:hypothetical protein FS837_009003 [Tulasnella sp. UAMH 9824]
MTTVSTGPRVVTEREKLLRRWAQSPWPAWSLGATFLATAPLSPGGIPGLPPFVQRIGFAAILGGAGYAVTQDPENGIGITTAWSLTYLFFNLRTSIRTRSPIPLVLTAATTACAGLYGTEYFYFRQSEAVDDAKKRRAQQRFDV